LWFFSALAVGLVLLRSFVPAWYEGYDFNSDQAIVGLMAKHLTELKTFPLFFYGQHYMLGVQAWMAAPFFLAGGPTVLMLRLPLVLVNCASALILLVSLVRQVKLDPGLAFVATLPLVIPTPLTASYLLQTLGASCEPLLYVLLLWLVRRRPLWFGIVLGVGFLHREFTIFAVPALLVVMALEHSLWTRTSLENVLAALAAFVAVWTVVDIAKAHVDVFGPTTGQVETGPLTLQLSSLASRICFEPAGVAARLQSLWSNCLAHLLGARPVALSKYGLDSALVTGSTAVGWLIAGAVLLFIGRLATVLGRGLATDSVLFCVYLTLVGLQATAAYPFACEVRPESPGLIRYVLLALLVPVAVSAMYLRRETVPALKAVAVSVLVFWAAVNVRDNVWVIGEYRSGRPVFNKRTLADYLVGHRVKYSRADYWDAYVLDFLARERVTVATTWKVRIREYEHEVDDHHAQAATIVRQPCSSGIPVSAWCVQLPPWP